MNTKASSVLLMIFELLAVILVIYLVISISEAYGSSLTVQKINAAEEMRMMIDTLVGIPDDALVQYPKNLSLFTLTLTNDAIAIYQSTEPQNLWVMRSITLPKNHVAEGTVGNISHVCLEKKHKKIILRACTP